MKAEEINKKIDITWAAVEIYQDRGRVSIPDLVAATKLSATEIYSYFPNKKAILAYYYPALVFQYWAMIDEIEDFESYSISEKFSNFIYSNFDLMTEKFDFVEDTFDKLVFKKGSKSEFHEEVTALFKEFLTTDADIAVSAAFFMNDFYYKALTGQYLLLVKFWLSDTSENKERTLAFADKLAALFEELVYNKSIDKTFDLFKYVFSNTSFEEHFPNWKCTSKTKKHHTSKDKNAPHEHHQETGDHDE